MFAHGQHKIKQGTTNRTRQQDNKREKEREGEREGENGLTSECYLLPEIPCERLNEVVPLLHSASLLFFTGYAAVESHYMCVCVVIAVCLCSLSL